MIADLRGRLGADPGGRDVLLLGAGGAARAAAFALLDAGARSLMVANRTPARAQELVDALREPERAHALEWAALDRCAGFDLIVDATSAGVQQAALALPRCLVKTRTFAYDLSYGRAARTFVEWAQAAGCTAMDGLGMLVETAAASFERWHGVRPDANAALKAIRAGTRP
jgi:shikimate dehydrogenase